MSTESYSNFGLGLAFLKAAASALLAVFLWWLVLLGVNLHVH